MPDRDWTIIVILGIAWGSTFFFNEMLLRDMGPVWVAFMRLGTAAIGCWVWLLFSGRAARLPLAVVGQLSVMGLAMFALPFTIFPLAQQYVATGVAGIVNALTPVMVVIVSHIWQGGEKATPLKSLGVASGFLGIVFLTLPAMSSDEENRLFGTLVLVLAPLSFAFAMNYVRRFHGIGIDLMVAWAFTMAAVMLLPAAALIDGMPGPVQASTWASVAFLGLVLTALAFTVAFRILPRAGATKTSTITFIAPVSALLIGWLVLDETLGPFHFAGMAAIFLGLLLIDGTIFRGRRIEKIN